MVAVARNICTAKNTPRARENIYLLSIIYYLKSTVVQTVFVLLLRRVTFVMRHKSNQKDFASHTAQEGIKMTALRGKSLISLPLRLQLSCAEPIFPSDAAFICKQERRVGINLRFKSI